MNYHIEKLNEQTWLIEEYSNTASAYMYLLTGREKALLIDTGFGTIPLKSICEELTVLPVTVALTHGHRRCRRMRWNGRCSPVRRPGNYR